MQTNTMEEFEVKQLKNRTGKKGNFEISKITVFTTKEYDQFQILRGNRKVDRARVNKLVEEMRKNDLHPHRPIMIDENFGIIEGQHTFEARRQMGRPVYFTICPKQTTVNIAGFNNAVRQWKNEDYLDAFIGNRNPEYVKLKSWITKNDLSIGVALCFMGGQGQTQTAQFKNGTLQFVNEDDTQLALALYKKIGFYNSDSRRKSNIARACSIVTNAHGYDQARMFRQLEANKDKIDSKLNVMDSIRLLENFYNHNFPMGPNYLRLM